MGRSRDQSISGEMPRKAVEYQESSEDSLPIKYHPVDRGWAWIIMIGVFVIHFFTTGYLRSFGLLFVEFQNHFQSSSTLTATMSGIQMLAYSLGTFVTVNVLMKFISVKTSCLLGCCLEVMSVAGNCLVTDIKQLIFTHGILFGVGQALMYCPAMVILSEYFDKRRPISTVFATGGVSAGGIAMPFLIRYLLDTYGLIGGVLVTAGVIFQQAVFVSFFTSPSEYTPAEVNESDCYDENKAFKSIPQEPASNENGIPPLIEDKYILKTQKQRGEHPNGSTHDVSIQHSHESQDFDSNKQIYLPKDYVGNNITDIEHIGTLNVQALDSQLSSQAKDLTLEDGNVPTSLHPHDTNAKNNDISQSSNSITHEGDGEIHPKQESSLYSKINPTVAETENETHTLLLLPENSHPMTSNQRSKQSFLKAGINEPIYLSKSSINSTHSFAHSDNLSRTGYAGTCKDKLKLSRNHLHTLGVPSDTLVRALSTSSVDVLGSAHPISQTGSMLSVRRRGRGSSLDRAPHSNYERRDQHTSRFRLPECKVPEMVKRPTFWFVAVYFCGGGLASVLPTVFLPPLAQSRDLDASSSSHFLVVSAIMEMFGRLVPGLVLHFGYMRPSTAVIPSMVLCGILLQLVTFFNNFKSLLILSCLIGFFTGSFWAMQVLVVIEIIGMESLGQAFGFYSIVLGFGVGAGFPLAGAMVDATGTYNIPYNFFGAMYLLASLMMVLVQFTRRPDDLEPSVHGEDDGFEDDDCDQENA